MALKVLVMLLVLSVVLEFSGVCQGQYQCIFTKCKREELEDPKVSLPESADLDVPLNEYRRNKLGNLPLGGGIRRTSLNLGDLLLNKRNRLADAEEED
ncbi:hypothetical protein OS493_006501 [Desmophyllum pertusum]|uniref:Uncharacterized protein n=1 Tax=Desmophyllum pertusum TaxID=174260 RepID=A0A9X0A506_9CNID|nr:hypothetical protein OS493_006501 [Desmophyllum pertusum]